MMPAMIHPPAGQGPAAPAARARDVTRVYGHGQASVTALDRVSLDIPAGSFTAVMGPSGSGKSTLMHCMAGLDAVTSGRLWIGETEISRLRERQLTRLRRDRIGFVFQAYNLLPVLSAEANITLPLDIAGRAADPGWLATVIETVGLGDRMKHRPNELSGGQQQRVAVARALAGRPDIVFADEPTGNLDSRAGAEVLGLLRRSVREFGQTVVMVTHDPGAASYADRVVFLADGQIAGGLDRPTPASVLDAIKNLGE
jgi:putative ABC transport system ATP-binding protein